MVASEDSDGPILGLEAVPEPLPWFDDQKNYPAYDSEIRELRDEFMTAVTSLGRPPMEAPLTVRLSKCLYPATDGHLDVLVRFDMEPEEQPGGNLLVRLQDDGGEVLSEERIDSIPGAQLFFSYRLPKDFTDTTGELQVIWEHAGGTAEATASFRVAETEELQRSGRVELAIPNSAEATVSHAPMTVGVPFPRGVLESDNHLRLLDAEGNEIPLQTEVTARWSRFGDVKWVQCDFTIDMDGSARTLYLEYGPEVRRETRSDLVVGEGNGFPSVDAGRLRVDSDGVYYDSTGQGDFELVLPGEALTGAFVRSTRGISYADSFHSHFAPNAEGRLFTMGDNIEFSVEEDGPEKVVIRADGWYEEKETGATFCKFRVRYQFFKDSPVIRIFHTWIFTGDGNRDTIRTMGWEFPVAEMEPAGFLSSFSEPEWLEGYYLRQDDHDSFTLFEYEVPRSDRRMVWDDAVPERPLKEKLTGERAPGVMKATGSELSLFVGVQDFWQNFPASMRLTDDALVFHQWPRYGRARENPVSAADMGNIWRMWWVHEGEALNFTLPQAMTEDPIYREEGRSEPHFAMGQPDSINAQGIAKTAEMWLYVAPGDQDENSVRVMEGLASETLRAIPDPRWLADSGAFYEMAAADFEAYPELEEGFRQGMLSQPRQIERMGVYGKWIYGDLLRPADLDSQESGLYRTFRKSHWGWPYSWGMFARSGDVEFLRPAQAATRMMTDTAFTHYVDPELAEHFATEQERRHLWTSQQPFRAIGWNNRNLIPWAGYWGPSSRCYVDQADYLWDAWYLTGYHRAKDVALAWAEQTKIEEPEHIMRGPITAAQNRARWPANLQKQYVEMYEATWDPWFLAAAQAIADMHVWRFREEDWPGHFWHAGYYTWHRFAGCQEHAEFLQANADHWTDPHQFGWGSTPTTTLPGAVQGYHLTGDDYYVRRAAGVLDTLRWTIYPDVEGEEYLHGIYVFDGVNSDLLYKSWLQLWYPWVIDLFNRTGGEPENPVYPPFDQTFGRDDRIAVLKEDGKELPLRVGGRFEVTGPDGEVVEEGNEDVYVLAADAPAGVYQVALRGKRRLPLSPPDNPEVLLTPAGGQVGSADLLSQYWFKVPEGTDSFEIEFDNSRTPGQPLRQVVVWGPDGEEVWAHRQRAIDYDSDQEVIRAVIEVEPGQQGQLWRLTSPARNNNMPFRFSEEIPTILAHEPERWFDPKEAR